MPKTKFSLADFSLPLSHIMAEPRHIWVNSGFTTVQPRSGTVIGVNAFHSPPFAVPEFELGVELFVNGRSLADQINHGKGDVGLLYSGGTWFPHQIERQGTYHHFVDGQLVSLHVVSHLVPLAERAGFALQLTLTNRSSQPLELAIEPHINPGRPRHVPLDQWLFSTPKNWGEVATITTPTTWENREVKLHFFQENTPRTLPPQASHRVTLAVVITAPEESVPAPATLAAWIEAAHTAWQTRLDRYLAQVPTLHSDVPGLDTYYRRSLVSGLVCIWENPAFLLNPHISTSGMDGGSVCSYMWDIGGYAPHMLNLMLGEQLLPLARHFLKIDLQKHNAFAPSGQGIGTRYAYSPWSFVRLVCALAAHHALPADLYAALKTFLMDEERLADRQSLLVDYGRQPNLLEMRAAGYEHIVASPNAERAWALRQLATMAELQGDPAAPVAAWRKRAEQIIEAIRTLLWDAEAGWFRCHYPDGHTELVYSVQIFDALRAGACSPEMAQQLYATLHDGGFLGQCGVHSVSQSDRLHFELNDPDWSGGGAFSGEGPQLALTLFEQGQAERGWDVLQRHFWMGAHLPYFPQEHYADKPFAPPHKRANIIAGLTGAEAILHGMIGFRPQLDGRLRLEPHWTGTGQLELRGYGFRGHLVDVQLSPAELSVWVDGELRYQGPPQKVEVV